MDSYRVEKQTMQKIILAGRGRGNRSRAGGWRRGVGMRSWTGGRPSSISSMICSGAITWEDADRVRQMITETIPARVAEDTAFQNARRNSDPENTWIEHDKALVWVWVMTEIMKDDTELFKQFVDNEGFKRWLGDTVFGLAYQGVREV